jgi:hypothetical protein
MTLLDDPIGSVCNGDDHVFVHVQASGLLHDPLHVVTSRYRTVRESLVSQSLKIALAAAVHGTHGSHVWLDNDLAQLKDPRRQPDGTRKFSPDHTDPPGPPTA